VEAKKTGGFVLEDKDIRAGLSQLARNPFTLSHSYAKLDLTDKQLKSIDAVQKYKNVQTLMIDDNFVTDLSCLSNLPYLLTLSAANNKITECLSYNVPLCDDENRWAEGSNSVGSQLNEADLSGNNIEKIADLSPHCYLHSLNLNNNKIEVIEGLNLPLLTYLNLEGNKISKIEGLDKLSCLVELDLTNNNITELVNLTTGLGKLEKLHLSGNKIVSLKGLRHCQLRELDVSDNNISVIRQVEYLQKMVNLSELVLSGNECCGKEFYRLRAVARLVGISILDNVAVTAKEKVKAINLYAAEGSDLENRIKNFNKQFGAHGAAFVNTLPPFVEDEVLEDAEDNDELGEYKNAENFVEVIFEDAMKSLTSSMKLQ